MDKLYRTHRIHFSLHFCRELEFMINMCLYQVRAIKSDSLNGGEELEGRGNRCMAEHTCSCGNYTFSNFKFYRSGFSNPEKNVEIWAFAGVSCPGPEILLNNILIKVFVLAIYLYLVQLHSFSAVCTLANSSKVMALLSSQSMSRRGGYTVKSQINLTVAVSTLRIWCRLSLWTGPAVMGLILQLPVKS